MVRSPVVNLPDWAIWGSDRVVRVWRMAVRMRASSSEVPKGLEI